MLLMACIRCLQMVNTAIKCCTKSNPQIIFRPQDLVVLLSLPLEQGAAPTYAALASELSLTASESHAGLDWTTVAQLARKGRARKPALYELLVLFDAIRGGSASERALSKLIMDKH